MCGCDVALYLSLVACLKSFILALPSATLLLSHVFYTSRDKNAPVSRAGKIPFLNQDDFALELGKILASIGILKCFLYDHVFVAGESIFLYLIFCLVMAVVWMFES